MLRFDSVCCRVMVNVVAQVEKEIHESQAQLAKMEWLEELQKEALGKFQLKSFVGRVIFHGLTCAIKAHSEGKILDSYLMIKIVQEWAELAEVDVSVQIGELTPFNFSEEEIEYLKEVYDRIGYAGLFPLRDLTTCQDLEAEFQRAFGRRVSAEIILIESRFLLGQEGLPPSLKYMTPERLQKSLEILQGLTFSKG